MTERLADTFVVGDRVVRHMNVFDERSKLMHGTVVDAYSLPQYAELFAVKWDGSKTVHRGYLPHGLNKEES